MTDQEIIDLAYEYANCFSSGIVFKDEQLVEFARAVLEKAQQPQDPLPDYRNHFTSAYLKALRG